MNGDVFNLAVNALEYFDTVVCGGGFAGAAAAWASASNGAKTLLIESGGELSGDLSKSLVPQILDPDGKGGLVKETYDYLNSGAHTSARRGARYDARNQKIPGTVVDLEYTKYYFEKRCRDAGVVIMYHAIVAGCECENSKITSIAVATECGSYRIKAHTYIDATGNGLLAAMAGCRYEIGHPETGQPQPAAIMMFVTGLPEGITCDDEVAKERIKAELVKEGVITSTEGVALIETTIDDIWLCAFGRAFDLMMNDPIAMSEAICKGRAECVEGVDCIRQIPGYENINIVQVSKHIGIREGKRIFGRYRLTFDDVTTGAKFEDGICLVDFCIDVHKISADDERDHQQGKRVVSYHIPYRSLLPLDCDNLLLAGRCISGDFYAHASYRVIGNVTPTGEAAGFAAAICAKRNILPYEVDGKEVSGFMRSRGYSL